jgi:phage shock protein A
MGKALKRMWRYLTAALTGKFNEMADPKIQLEQAIAEAQEQQRRLKEQAANVIANQKQTEMRLNRILEELEKTNGSAQQAVVMAAEAEQRGDETKAADYNRAAESFANRLISLEREVDDLKALHLQASQASDQAKAAVNQNAMVMQRKLAERQKLLSQLDQAKMAEQMNSALESVSSTVGEDVPTLKEVRDKIESRLAKARGMAELQQDSVEGRMREVEQAVTANQAQARLSEMRSRLGLAPAGEQAPAAAPTPAPEATVDAETERGKA